MPIKQETYSRDIVVLTCCGSYTFDDVLSEMNTAAELNSSDPVALIFDVRESKSPRTLDEFRSMASKLSDDARFGMRHASVLDVENPLYFAMTRQIQALASNQGIDYGMFGSIEEAVEFVQKPQ